MTKPMTHLQAFLGEDAKNGRIWEDEDGEYMRSANGDYMYRVDKDNEWGALRQQVASAEGTVTWADEPRTLTPQELFAMLRDRKCLATKNGAASPWALCFWDGRVWVSSGWSREHLSLAWNIVPDPSQPAEPVAPPRGKPISEWKKSDCQYTGGNPYIGNSANPPRPAEPTKPPLKVGDRVKIVGVTPHARGRAVGLYGAIIAINHDKESFEVLTDDGRDNWWFAPGDIEKNEAEPQVEYPLTYAEALVAAHADAVVACELAPDIERRVSRGHCQITTSDGNDDWGMVGGFADNLEKQAKWRIVEGK